MSIALSLEPLGTKLLEPPTQSALGVPVRPSICVGKKDIVFERGFSYEYAQHVVTLADKLPCPAAGTTLAKHTGLNTHWQPVDSTIETDDAHVLIFFFFFCFYYWKQ